MKSLNNYCNICSHYLSNFICFIHWYITISCHWELPFKASGGLNHIFFLAPDSETIIWKDGAQHIDVKLSIQTCRTCPASLHDFIWFSSEREQMGLRSDPWHRLMSTPKPDSEWIGGLWDWTEAGWCWCCRSSQLELNYVPITKVWAITLPELSKDESLVMLELLLTLRRLFLFACFLNRTFGNVI